ncbi:hypothetical protein [Terrimonas alba]|uniref:hypothetical protein n=1 Tax=Terrimonas alba TaxID=3349636 RepID=UPI0035F26EB1
MKKLLFLSTLIVFTIMAVQAQIKTKTEKTRLQAPSKIIEPVPTEPKIVPPPPPPPATTNKTSGTANTSTPVYILSSARVSIRTGSDNKEFPSAVWVALAAKSAPAEWRTYVQQNLGNEMRINSETEFGLGLEAQPISLETFQKSGLVLRIQYNPNIIFDAWKIESVSLTLEFKDQNGNLHPSLGRKTIVFSNAYGFLNNDFRYMKCFTDESFSPLTAVISKEY